QDRTGSGSGSQGDFPGFAAQSELHGHHEETEEVTLYPDSSFIVAARIPHDTFHHEALRFYRRRAEDVWLWSPWHRVEVFNTIRQLTRHPDARRVLNQSEAKAIIHRLENDVRVGHFTHLEADWRDV